MRKYPPRFTSSLDLLGAAAALARAKIGVVYGPAEAQLPRFLFRIAPPRILSALALNRVQSKQVPIIRGFADCDLIVVPEFVGIPMLLAGLRIWKLRHKVICMLSHNVQRAHMRRSDRWALRLLAAAGFRLGCYESSDGIAELGLETDAAHLLTLPLAIGAGTGELAKRPAKSKRVVGIIGRYRPEKDFDGLIERLIDARSTGALGVEIVLGFPEAAARARWSDSGVIVLNTETAEAYWQALASCDVVVLNYARSDYFYRSSNVITDAVSRGVAVVCPDFPVLRHQVMHPAPVGATFGNPSELVPAILQAFQIAEKERANFEAYIEARQLRVIADLFDRFIAASRGC